MNREKLNLTSEQGRDIVYGDDSNFVTVEGRLIVKRQLNDEYKIVVKRKSDGKYFKDIYCRGNVTEDQHERPYEYSKPNFKEVFPVTKTYVDYE